MKIAAVCCTFLRPRQLGHLIRCFLEQDYPAEKRELVILDDAGQYDNQQGDRWRLVSTDRRFPTLGEKRNAAAALVSGDVEALAVWDDDDLYLPWALRASVAALEVAPWSRPSLVLHPQPSPPGLRQHETGGLFHGGWAYARPAFEQVGGYPAVNNGEDQAFARRLKQAGVDEADPIQLGMAPFYVYSWNAGSGWHLSGMKGDGYRHLGCLPRVKTRLQIVDPPHVDLDDPKILPGVHARMF
ncbi:MAG TPA: glycosyltransferase family A protein [Thermoguttaceae bacterium]|nr:glycosyltransferase family A protein [Thermoguttaceae bacterium]